MEKSWNSSLHNAYVYEYIPKKINVLDIVADLRSVDSKCTFMHFTKTNAFVNALLPLPPETYKLIMKAEKNISDFSILVDTIIRETTYYEVNPIDKYIEK